jgi:integrating conjugative element protein (TIGR03749 family)
MRIIKGIKKMKNQFRSQTMMNTLFNKVISSSIVLGVLVAMTFTAEGKPLPPLPVSALTLSVQDQQTLMKAASLPQDQVTKSLIWQGDPLPLHLSLNREQRLIFPEPVQVDVNGQLTTEQLRIINDHRNVYLTALTPFPKTTRIYVTLKESGQIIFFDIGTRESSAQTPVKTQPIHVRVAESLKSSGKWLDSDSNTLPNDSMMNPMDNTIHTSFSTELTPLSTASADDLVQAVRFAWQQLYAPAYLLPNNLNFQRIPLHSSFWVSGLFYSDTVFAHPMASWMYHQMTITAIELRNPYSHVLNLAIDRDLCGHWQAAMLFPRSILQPVDRKPENSTTLFLVSNEPFMSALGVCHGRV